MDNLLHPEGALLQAQSLLAEAYGAAQAWFGTCGSTMGNYALILSCAKPDDLILLASDCHISAVHAALLAHYRISLISCDQTAQGLPQPMSYQKSSRGSVLPSRSQGARDDQPQLLRLFVRIYLPLLRYAMKKCCPFLVDAAHGAHFGFSPLLPIQPVDADGWVVSAHKTLCVSNQGSLIFVEKKASLMLSAWKIMCIAFNLPAPLGLCWHKWTKPAPSCMNRALQIINACMPFSLIFKRQFPPCLCAVSRPIRSKRTFPAWCWMFPAWEHLALCSANSLLKWAFG